jgi:putative protein-disulfide isomerase
MGIDLATELQPTKNGELPKLHIFYYTDPDCSWCWAAEPKIKKIKEEYGGQVHITYRMGGLLEKWDGFYDPLNQISYPEQVAPHWVEVSQRSGMPIDEKIWFQDPPTSTYPSCIAYKAALLQDERLAELYLRRLREAVMTQRRNIARENVLFALAEEIGFDMDRFREAYLTGPAQAAFYEDLQETRGRGITGFPTLVMRNSIGREITLTGFRPYADYENAMKRLATATLHKMPLLPIIDFIRKYEHVATVEVAQVYEMDRGTAFIELDRLVQAGEAIMEEKAGGEFWQISNVPQVFRK